jgi:hypothetical protein
MLAPLPTRVCLSVLAPMGFGGASPWRRAIVGRHGEGRRRCAACGEQGGVERGMELTGWVGWRRVGLIIGLLTDRWDPRVRGNKKKIG